MFEEMEKGGSKDSIKIAVESKGTREQNLRMLESVLEKILKRKVNVSIQQGFLDELQAVCYNKE